MARIRKAQNDPFRNREAMAVHLRRIQGDGERATGVPTPERAIKANGSLRVGMDKVVRIEDSPLEKLAAKKTLDKDPTLNAIYKASGERYYRDHYLGMRQLGGMDPSRINVDGGGSVEAGGLPTTQQAEQHRRQWRLAANAVVAFRIVGPRLLQVLDAVVLEERTLLDIGLSVTRYSSKDAATAIALERLILALDVLAVHYGLKDH